MSHQTGAMLFTLPAQTTELTNSTKQYAAVQIMKEQVPEFQACKCHGRGTRQQMKPRKENIGKRGYVGSVERMEGEPVVVGWR